MSVEEGEPSQHDARGATHEPHLDALRGIAVLAVVAYHALPAWVGGGYVGVDVFFVLSGYLITGNILREADEGRGSFAQFYRRRVRRLFPALVVVLVGVWELARWVLPRQVVGQLPADVLCGALFCSNVLQALTSGYFEQQTELRPFAHLWSLAVEEQFYLLWPVLLVAAVRWRRSSLMLCAGLATGSLVASVFSAAYGRTEGFFLLHTRAWELLAGALVAEVLRRRVLASISPGQKDRLLLASLFGVFVSIFAYRARIDYPGFWAVLPVVSTCGAIASGSGRLGAVVLRSRALRLAGAISYPLYLWHWPLLVIVRYRALGNPSVGAKALAVGAAFTLSVLTWRFVERPIRQVRWPRWAGAIDAALVAAVGTVAVVAAVAWFAEKPKRQPLLHHVDVKDLKAAWREGRCFLQATQTEPRFADECLDTEPAGGPVVLLWGDSHAAHVRPGLLVLQEARGHDFRIAQYTSSHCGPWLDVKEEGHQGCPEINADVFRRISELTPHTVVLGFSWRNHRAVDVQPRLERTVSLLKTLGVKHITLVGPTPNWSLSLPTLVAIKTLADEELPERIEEPSSATTDVNEWARHKAASLGIDYVSPHDELCDASGCLTQAPNTNSPVQYDESHLSNEGSKFVFRHLGEHVGLPAPQ